MDQVEAVGDSTKKLKGCSVETGLQSLPSAGSDKRQDPCNAEDGNQTLSSSIPEPHPRQTAKQG